MSATIPTNPSAEMHATLKWLEGFNNCDLDQIFSMVAEDYTHYTFPQSLGIPPRSKAEFRPYLTKMLAMLVGFKVTIHEIIECPGKVVFHASSTATSTTGFPYANEYNITLHFTTQADGLPKISAVKEFVDSKTSLEFFTEEQNRQAARDAQQKV